MIRGAPTTRFTAESLLDLLVEICSLCHPDRWTTVGLIYLLLLRIIRKLRGCILTISTHKMVLNLAFDCFRRLWFKTFNLLLYVDFLYSQFPRKHDLFEAFDKREPFKHSRGCNQPQRRRLLLMPFFNWLTFYLISEYTFQPEAVFCTRQSFMQQGHKRNKHF